MKGKAALIGADVESFLCSAHSCPRCGCRVVLALVEKSSRLLSRVGVEVEAEAVEAEHGASHRSCLGLAFRSAAEEGNGRGRRESLKLANARIGPFPDGQRLFPKLPGQHPHADLADLCVVESF